MARANFLQWLEHHLNTLQLGDDVFVEYIHGMLDEESMSAEEKVESIETFLAAAAVTPFSIFFSSLKRFLL